MTPKNPERARRPWLLRACGVFARDVGHGLLEVSHNSLALLGLTVLALLAFVASRDDLRASAEHTALSWLQQRQEQRLVSLQESPRLVDLSEPAAVARATAADASELTSAQAALAQWISRRYKVAPEPVGRLVKEAWHVGRATGLEPTLILAIMAIESSFNPFAQSPVGAQGLMQVMTRIHDDKYQSFGGTHAAFDPVSNLRVGVLVLKECIARAGGSVEHGLRYYVGAANLEHDGGYSSKVLAEQDFLRRVVEGKAVAVNVQAPPPVPLAAPQPVPVVAPAPPAPAPATAPEQLAMR